MLSPLFISDTATNTYKMAKKYLFNNISLEMSRHKTFIKVQIHKNLPIDGLLYWYIEFGLLQ